VKIVRSEDGRGRRRPELRPRQVEGFSGAAVAVEAGLSRIRQVANSGLASVSRNVRISRSAGGHFGRSHLPPPDFAKTDGNPARRTGYRNTCEFPVPQPASLIGRLMVRVEKRLRSRDNDSAHLPRRPLQNRDVARNQYGRTSQLKRLVRRLLGSVTLAIPIDDRAPRMRPARVS
jgi:hypothetical protein